MAHGLHRGLQISEAAVAICKAPVEGPQSRRDRRVTTKCHLASKARSEADSVDVDPSPPAKLNSGEQNEPLPLAANLYWPRIRLGP